MTDSNRCDMSREARRTIAMNRERLAHNKARGAQDPDVAAVASLQEAVLLPFTEWVAGDMALHDLPAVEIAILEVSSHILLQAVGHRIMAGQTRDRAAAIVAKHLSTIFSRRVAELDVSDPDMFVVESDNGAALAAALKGRSA